MSALTTDITDAAAASPTAGAPLPPTPPEADLSTAAPTDVASRMEEAEAEVKLVGALEVSGRCPPPLSSQEFASWMRNNIHKKECCFFDRDKSEHACKCGYSKSEHVHEAIKPDKFTGQTWKKLRHIHEVPTDAFGDVSFGSLGQKTGKYARVSTDASPEILYQLLTNWWKLSPPNLLISVTGGAKNFCLKARLKKLFHRGLIKVAQTTGAWIITGGTHTGVMKHVGEAVKDYALSSSLRRQIVAIGVATWGIIHNRDALVQAEGCFPAHYRIDDEGQGRFSCLDDNHTHFLLVDDGTQGNYGVEIELRTRLEKFISGKSLGHKGSSMTIPAVCVVLDGGPGTLNTIYNAMMNGTPCVVFESSGRIADVIANVAGLTVGRITIADIKKLLKKFFGQEYDAFSDTSIVEWTKKIQDIVRMTDLLSVFRASEDNHGDVDMAILQALLKASKTRELFGIHSWKRQLELAIAWNRVDLAETEIFTEERYWKSSDLHEALFLALVGNKPQFVRLLLENGASLREFLQQDEALCKLYRQLPDCLFRRKLPKSIDSISLAHVSAEVKKLLGQFSQFLYPKTAQNDVCSMSLDEPSSSRSNIEMGSRTLIEAKGGETQRDPSRDLFLWAVVQKNRELAEIAWEQCKDCMCAALAANKILKKLAQEESDADEVQEMLELARHYEKHATGVFSECHKNDEERAQMLLVSVSSHWGRTMCLQLAMEANDKDFVAQSGVQALLTKIWCGQLSAYNPVWRVLLCMVFFPLIYTKFLIFRHDEISKRVNESDEGRETGRVRGSTVEATSTGLHLKNLISTKPLGVWARMGCLYSCPQVKFYWNIVSYFAFLFLFAVVLMVDFQVMPSRWEFLLYIWLLTLVFEEVRQLFDYRPGLGFWKNASIYINDVWNILDVLSIVLFMIGVALRLASQLFYPGKVILCLTFVVFCLRLMAIFTISRTLGPKIIIVKRMMRDMFFFMFLLSIWVVAYGVAKQGILIDNDDRLNWILRGVLYEPYRIIFGEFPTNIDYAAFDIEACSINGTDRLKPKCPVLNEHQMPAFPEWLTIIMLCIYLLFANILLLNLLIAIFNFTFQEVQDNTDKIWKFQRYQLIKEYHSRPSAPPPLIILNHLYLFIQFLVLQKPSNTGQEFQIELSKGQEEDLLSWEALMKDRYLVSLQQEQNGNMEKRVQETIQKLGNLTDRLERDDERPEAVMQRLARLEEQAVQSARALQWIIDTLKSQDFAAKDAPTLTFAADEASGQAINTTRIEEQHHVNARQLSYPGGQVSRFPVPEEKVPWEVRFNMYQPTRLSCDDWDRVDGSDPEGLDKYKNPRGRTGIRGRGALRHLGPNFHLHLVLTRWRDSKQSVLEYLAVRDESSLALPEGSTQSAQHLPVTLKETLGKTLYEKLNSNMFEKKKVFGSYVDDCKNTDNAWVEILVVNIHLDRRSEVLVDLNNEVASSRGSLEWQEVSSKAGLSSSQRDFLRLVATLHNSRF